MSEDTARPPRRRSRFRVVMWIVLAGLVLLFLINTVFPDLDLSSEERIAVVRVEGVILDAQQTIGELKRYGENPLVKAVVIRIDSPGGGVVPSQEIHDAVKRIRDKHNKLVIASMGTVAASGGYYIAAATDHVHLLIDELTPPLALIHLSSLIRTD